MMSETVISIIETRMENHPQFISILPELLVKEDYMPAVYEMIRSMGVKESIRKLLREVPRAVIIDGTGFIPYDILDDIRPGTNLVFINRFEGKKDYDASYILSDYAAGGYMAVRHLLGLGRKKIMIMTYEINPGWTSEIHLKGCLKALDEAGLEPVAVLSHPELPPEEKYEEIFSGGTRPDGVVSLSDWYLLTLGKYLQKANLKVPDDVALIGYFNTPWPDALDLTCLSIRPDFICEKAVEAVVGGRKIRLSVKPEFIFRESCPCR